MPTAVKALKTHISSNDKVNQVGRPTIYLGWWSETLADGSIILNQTNTAEATVQVAGITGANGRLTPYAGGIQLNGPDSKK